MTRRSSQYRPTCTSTRAASVRSTAMTFARPPPRAAAAASVTATARAWRSTPRRTFSPAQAPPIRQCSTKRPPRRRCAPRTASLRMECSSCPAPPTRSSAEPARHAVAALWRAAMAPMSSSRTRPSAPATTLPTSVWTLPRLPPAPRPRRQSSPPRRPSLRCCSRTPRSRRRPRRRGQWRSLPVGMATMRTPAARTAVRLGFPSTPSTTVTLLTAVAMAATASPLRRRTCACAASMARRT